MDSRLNNAFDSIQIPEISADKRRQILEQANQAFKEKSESLKESHHPDRPINTDKSKWTFFRRLFMKRTTNYGEMVAASLIALTLGYTLFQATSINTNILPLTDSTEFEPAVTTSAQDEVTKTNQAEPDSSGGSISNAQYLEITKNQEEGSFKTLTSKSRVSTDQAVNKPIVMPAETGLYTIQTDIPFLQAKSRNQFTDADSNLIKETAIDPISTFSIDTDTASYSFIRRQLEAGNLPEPGAVRIEEMINYFDYNYPIDTDVNTPFSTTAQVVPSPWNVNNKLIHIGIKAVKSQPMAPEKSNLVFLIDTSGSMQTVDKLPLLISSFRLLLNTLSAEDKVSIVTYAGSAGILLEPTSVKDKAVIINALDQLLAGGSTAGRAGIQQAYALAQQHYQDDAVNRVFLATDGDFNVGISDPDQLKRFIAKKRDSGVYLSILGFGDGNYNDRLMQALAQNGNGQAFYIDNLNEAQKVLVEQASSTLYPVAKDVKIQVEFNPQVVAQYRLIGYETRNLKTQDFNNDNIDAAEIGAGHTVTAIYEITPVESAHKRIDEPRYSNNKTQVSTDSEFGNEYAFLKIRYKKPGSQRSQKMTATITRDLEKANLNHADPEVRFAIAVSAFGQQLKQSTEINNLSYDDIVALAQASKGDDAYGYRSEFIRLVKLAKSLNQNN